MSEWVFMVADSRTGSKTMISQHYDEVYHLTPQGTWVGYDDVEWLKQIRIYAPCVGCQIFAFSEGNPTAKQYNSMPSRSPKPKEVLPKYKTRKRKRQEDDEIETEEGEFE